MDILKQLGIEAINQGTCIGGEQWSDGPGSGTAPLLTSFNPTNGTLIAQVQPATSAAYSRVVQGAVDAFQSWRKVPAPLRGELVRRMGQALREKKDALGSLVSLEMGKIKAEGDGEVQEMIDMADFAVGQSRMLYGKTMHSERPEHRMYEQWHPLGVVGVISAFNFPVAVWSWNAFIAAICGNTVVWKPSPKTPLTAIAVQHICNEVLQDCGYRGIFNLFIENKQSLAEAMVDDRRIAKLSFTGSTTVGRQINVKVAQRMGRSLLELSGNNAIIVDEDAELDITVPAIVFGSVGTAGQRCTSTRRLLVHENIKDKLLERLKHAYHQIVIGDPLDKDTLVGPLIDEVSVVNFVKALDRVKELGGQVIAGGKIVAGKGYFVQPTLVSAVQNHWDVVQNETFAPILYFITYKTFAEAIALQNDARHGLSSAVFTNNLQHAEQFLSSVGSDCGIANVNIGTSGAEIGGAFGGEKETGGGREAGSDAWKAYMRRQTNTLFWGEKPTLAQGVNFNI